MESSQKLLGLSQAATTDSYKGVVEFRTRLIGAVSNARSLDVPQQSKR